MKSALCQVCGESFPSYRGRVLCFAHRNEETERTTRQRLRRFGFYTIAWDVVNLTTLLENEE